MNVQTREIILIDGKHERKKINYKMALKLLRAVRTEMNNQKKKIKKERNDKRNKMKCYLS